MGNESSRDTERREAAELRRKYATERGPSYTQWAVPGGHVYACHACMNFVAVLEVVDPEVHDEVEQAAPYGLLVREYHAAECPVLGEWIATNDATAQRWLVVERRQGSLPAPTLWPTWHLGIEQFEALVTARLYGGYEATGRAMTIRKERWIEHKAVIAEATPNEPLFMEVDGVQIGLVPAPSHNTEGSTNG